MKRTTSLQSARYRQKENREAGCALDQHFQNNGRFLVRTRLKLMRYRKPDSSDMIPNPSAVRGTVLSVF